MGLLTEKLKAKFEQFPLGSQEGKGFDAECIAKFFVAAATWFITEASKEEDDYILFGYLISYTFRFNGQEEDFGISLTKNGIDGISSGNGLIKHPLSHLTLWVQWVVDDYKGQYYDFDLGTWVDKP